MLLSFGTPYLNNYMRMVEDTESPRLYHLWAAMWGMSASLGRRCWLMNGPFSVYPNAYVILVGSPGMRKNAAAGIILKLLREHTNVRFAPASTGWHSNGLLYAMAQKGEEIIDLEKHLKQAGKNSIEELSADELMEAEFDTKPLPAAADKHALAICSLELSRFLGQKAKNLVDFLTDIWDCPEVYDYQTASQGKTKMIFLRNPLLNLLGCTTTSQLMDCLPDSSVGHGILSRLLLVFGQARYKSVPVPKIPPAELMTKVGLALHEANTLLHGQFVETKGALDLRCDLYDSDMNMQDARFMYYAERRQSHLIKLAMAFAASRCSTELVKEDYENAIFMLRETERFMPNALGEFGMSKIAAAKQQIVEYIQRANEPLSFEVLRGIMHRDLSMGDLKACMDDLVASGQLIGTRNQDNTLVFLPKLKREDVHRELEKLMMQQGEQQARAKGAE